MRIEGIEWSQKVINKLERKHGICPAEVEAALRYESVHLRKISGVYAAYCRNSAGRYLFVVLRIKSGGIARIITARDMTPAERRLYKKATS